MDRVSEAINLSRCELGSSQHDMVMEAIQKAEKEIFGACAYCGEPMRGIIRVHHHTEKGVDVTV